MSIWDAALFGLMATGGVYSFVYLFPFPQFFSPGFSATWLIIFTMVFAVLSYFVYAGLGSAMPRAGGDYLYETRTVARIVGFAIPWGSQVVAWLVFPVTGAFVINTLGLIPICTAFGLDSAASWLATPAGGTVVAFVVILIEWALAAGGLRYFRIAQRYVFVPFMVIGMAAIIVLFLVKWNADYVVAFNTYNAAEGITVASVHEAATKAGMVVTGFSLYNTAIWIGVLAGIIPYTMYAAQGMLGEVKEASNFGRLFKTFLLPGMFMGIFMLLIPWLLVQHAFTNTFLNEFAVAYGSGGIAPAYSPNINVFVAMLEPNKWAILVVSLGFIGGGFGISSTVLMNASRVMMAMSLDRLLPAIMSKVSTRTYTPVIGISIWAVVSAVIGVWFNYGDQALVLAILTSGMVTSTLVVGVTCLGGALFAYRAPDIYASAPVKRYTIGGSFPLITLIGGIAAAWVALMIYWAIVKPELGIAYSTPRIFLSIAYGSGVVVYFLWRLIERSRGVDLSLSAREVPPE
ncbi:MAG TPA: amino acid permease [Thermoleophilia bacterium]|nr:amino acid permease [Thermoleophilia bacterium]